MIQNMANGKSASKHDQKLFPFTMHGQSSVKIGLVVIATTCTGTQCLLLLAS